jgi:very-short-patch-repair endonuclease
MNKPKCKCCNTNVSDKDSEYAKSRYNLLLCKSCQDKCYFCGNFIDIEVLNTSISMYNIPLCAECQAKLNAKSGEHHNCKICNNLLIYKDYRYMLKVDWRPQEPLCEECYGKFSQIWQKSRKDNQYTTKIQVLIHMALQNRGIVNELNFCKEYSKDKRIIIDIAIESAKIYIEVNGIQHAQIAKQQRSDLWRAYYASLEGYLTLNVFNTATDENFRETIETIAMICDKTKNNKKIK